MIMYTMTSQISLFIYLFDYGANHITHLQLAVCCISLKCSTVLVFPLIIEDGRGFQFKSRVNYIGHK